MKRSLLFALSLALAAPASAQFRLEPLPADLPTLHLILAPAVLTAPSVLAAEALPGLTSALPSLPAAAPLVLPAPALLPGAAVRVRLPVRHALEAA
ncbi:MAG: hypothetical protein KGL53_17170, partial [Elusimicrobia bacterium]|nr:hypothetical protein [Elusimicrobiota bacterium]